MLDSKGKSHSKIINNFLSPEVTTLYDKEYFQIGVAQTPWQATP
jgi:hypothetical protein